MVPNDPVHDAWHPHPDSRREWGRCPGCGAIWWAGPAPAAGGAEVAASEGHPWDCLEILRILPPSDLTPIQRALLAAAGAR
jgi:hypothetical protein